MARAKAVRAQTEWNERLRASGVDPKTGRTIGSWSRDGKGRRWLKRSSKKRPCPPGMVPIRRRSERIRQKEVMPQFTFRGTPSEIGAAHGARLKRRIRGTWTWYASFFAAAGGDETTLKQMGNTFKETIRRFDSKYCEEIDAIASGAEMEAWKLYCLNARTEVALKLLAERDSRDDEPSECTSVFYPRHGVLAQNWDWDETLENLAVVSKIVRPDGHTLLTMHEPGILAKVGLSSAGVGCCLNALHCPSGPLSGVPVHVLLRSALDASSFEDARARIEKHATRGTAAHVLLANHEGKYAMIEMAGRRYDFVRSKTGCPAALHTNHYLACGLSRHSVCGFPRDADVSASSTRSRFVRGSELIESTRGEIASSTREKCVALAKRLLGDREGSLPICREMIETNKSGGLGSVLGRTGTVCSIVMDLVSRRMHITRGSPLRHPYVIIPL